MQDSVTVEVIDHNEGYAQEIRAREHVFWADEPPELEGLDSGPTPIELLLAALGSCTTITMRMYARKKGWEIERLKIRLTHTRSDSKEGVDKIEKEIQIQAQLTEEQRARLLEISDRCPVNRLLKSQPDISSTLTDLETA